MPLCDSCGFPMERGAMRRVGPTRQYFFGARAGTPASVQARNNKVRSYASVLDSEKAHQNQKKQPPSSSSLAKGGQQRAHTSMEADPRRPDMTKHRRRKVASNDYDHGSYTNKVGPYASTVQRSMQKAQEDQLMAQLYTTLEEKEQSAARDRKTRDQFRSDMRVMSPQGYARLGTPEAKDDVHQPAVDWSEFHVQRQHRHGYAPSTVISTQFGSSNDVAKLKKELLLNERSKRETEVTGVFSPHRNPVQCSQLFGDLPNGRLKELERHKRQFKKDAPNPTAEVERVEFEKEYNRLVRRQKNVTANPDLDRADVLSLGGNESATQQFYAPRPSEKHLGTIPVGKAYPYQRQLHMRRQLDEINLKKQMVGAVGTLGAPRQEHSVCAGQGGTGGVEAFYNVSHLSPSRKPRD